MRINHTIRMLLSVVAVAMVILPMEAQNPQCKDTAEHRRLQTAMWEASGQDSVSQVYEACTNFLHHAREDNDIEAVNSSWVCGILYNLGRMNIHDAYHITQVMKNDINASNSPDEGKYFISNMMGHVYSTCGNIPGAEEEFLKALDQIKGVPYERDGRPFIYLALAHVQLNNDLDKTLHWLDEGEEYLKENKDSWNYNRVQASIYAIRAVVRFKQKDFAGFRKNIALMDEFTKRNQIPQGDIFIPLARAYEMLLDGKTEEALAASVRLQNLKEQYLLQCDIYRHIGDDDKAFLIQRELMHKRDSITGVMIAENMHQQEEEMQLMRARQKAARTLNYVLVGIVALAVLLIIMLHRNIFLRRRYSRHLKAKNQELKVAYEKVAAADEMKTHFIRNVSHEIRTPLNIIYGFTQVITNEENSLEPHERREIAETIGSSTRQITSLVNKMLALANANTKDLLEEVEETDALDICQKALQAMPPVDAEKIKVELEDLTSGKGSTLCTNSDSLQQMLGDILENAVKFTEKGHIKLKLQNDGQMMCFTVEDTGCGIPEDKISTIFERFTKVDEFKEGLGIGLAYCHETVERLGGELKLDYTSDKGTSFTLKLPLEVKRREEY